MDLTGNVALVTGAGGGIGAGIARALADHGADVAAADVRLGEAQRVAREVEQAGQRAIAVSVDVTSADSIVAAVNSVLETLGKIDILVNNAGVFGGPGWVERDGFTGDDWDLTHAVNLKGVAMVTDAVAPHMIERRSGKIINVASVGGRRGDPINPPYMASKAGAISLTQSTAMALAPHNINVNAICPGFVWTGMAHDIEVRAERTVPEMAGLSPREVYDRLVAAKIPLGRDQSPQDIGRLAVFLASEYSRNITGQAINIDGGTFMN
jgi:NAD(P)-dependent dehydrogenase (short-subunit alcohol dehydrogenase family)